MQITFELTYNNYLNTERDIAGAYFDTDTIACALIIDGKEHSYISPETLLLSPAEIAERIRIRADELKAEITELEHEIKTRHEIADAITQLPADAIPTHAEVEAHQAHMDSQPNAFRMGDIPPMPDVPDSFPDDSDVVQFPLQEAIARIEIPVPAGFDESMLNAMIELTRVKLKLGVIDRAEKNGHPIMSKEAADKLFVEYIELLDLTGIQPS